MATIDIKSVEKSFGALKVLKSLDIHVQDGELLVLVGPSGCGKSTLLSMIAGLSDVSKGNLLIDGDDVTRSHPRDRDIAMVFQTYALYPTMTVRQNISFGLEMRRVPKAERTRAVEDVAALLQITHLLDRKPSQLSGGQRQRVALARAIVARPKLLLLDEPLSALDRRLRQKMQIELKALQSELGIAFVFVTHDQEEALTMSDRIVVMRGGQIEQCGAPRDIFRKPRTKFVAEFIGDTNLFETTIECVHDGRILALTREGTKIWLSEETKLAKGDAATVVIRPTDLQVQDAHSSCGFRGKITRVIYLGTDLHYYVQPAVGEQELLVVSRTDGSRRAPGDEVTLTYRPERAHVVEDC